MASGPGESPGGGGRHTFVLASYGMFVVGVDFAPEAVALAHIRAASLDVMNRTRFAVGDATALGFAADTFGLVNDDGCLHHLHPLHWPQWANEVLRVARPGGLIRIKVFAASSRIWPGFQPGETPEGGEGPQTRWVVEPSSGGTYFFIEEEVAGLLAGRAELLSLWESPHRHADAKRFFYAEFLVP